MNIYMETGSKFDLMDIGRVTTANQEKFDDFCNFAKSLKMTVAVDLLMDKRWVIQKGKVVKTIDIKEKLTTVFEYNETGKLIGTRDSDGTVCKPTWWIGLWPKLPTEDDLKKPKVIFDEDEINKGGFIDLGTIVPKPA